MKNTAERIGTKKVPFESAELERKIAEFFAQIIDETQSLRLIDCEWGVYAFYDYDDEPIYVGQTKEKISGRVR